MQIQTTKYAEWLTPLDSKGELSVTTIPAWYPDSDRVVPGFTKLTTDPYLALQFHVRKKGKEHASNPYVQSIRIHSFAYHLDDSPEKVLVENYDENLWSQPIIEHSNREKIGIPYRDNSTLHVTMDMTLNGTRHRLKGSMPAKKSTRILPNFAESP